MSFKEASLICNVIPEFDFDKVKFLVEIEQ